MLIHIVYSGLAWNMFLHHCNVLERERKKSSCLTLPWTGTQGSQVAVSGPFHPETRIFRNNGPRLPGMSARHPPTTVRCSAGMRKALLSAKCLRLEVSVFDSTLLWHHRSPEGTCDVVAPSLYSRFLQVKSANEAAKAVSKQNLTIVAVQLRPFGLDKKVNHHRGIPRKSGATTNSS